MTSSTRNKISAINLNEAVALMESSSLKIRGHDTWSGDADLKKGYINTAAERVRVTTNLILDNCASIDSLLEIGLSPGVGLAPLIGLIPPLEYCAALDSPAVFRITPSLPEKVDVVYKVMGKEIPLDYFSCNAEVDIFPFSDSSFDVVICSDVLEHLLLDPYHLVCEVNRVLKPGGYFLLGTSPSQAYWTHKVKLLLGRNMADPYSGYGPYGRHNRLYLPLEVVELVRSAGFLINTNLITASYPGVAGNITRVILSIFRFIPFIRQYLGSHILVLGKKTGAPIGRPSWLYEQWDKRPK